MTFADRISLHPRPSPEEQLYDSNPTRRYLNSIRSSLISISLPEEWTNWRILTPGYVYGTGTLYIMFGETSLLLLFIYRVYDRVY